MIKPIRYFDTEIYHKDGKKHNLIFNENTNYLGYFIKKKLCGFVGYDVLSNKAVLRTDYVLPEYRNNGIYKELHTYRVDLLKCKGIKKMELTCTDMSINYHLKSGAKIIKQYKNFTKVQYLWK